MNISLGAIEYPKDSGRARGLRLAQKFALALTTVTLAAVFLGQLLGPGIERSSDGASAQPVPAEVIEPSEETAMGEGRVVMSLGGGG